MQRRTVVPSYRPLPHRGPSRRGKIVLAILLILAWGVLAAWLLAPSIPWPFSHSDEETLSESSAHESVSMFQIPGVTVRVEKLDQPETYAAISKRLGISEAALRSLNQANDDSQPSVEIPLWVPSKDGVFHWVATGQGWSDIARAYGLPLGKILSANHKTAQGELKAGEILYLPGGAYLTQSDPRWKALARLHSDAGFQKPTTGRFADGFGMRIHPITHQETFHAGLDLAPGVGCKVFAAQRGTVIFAGDRSGYGHLIILDHGDGLTSWYAHLSEIRVVVKQTLLKGDWIGRVGATGRVTGPHLHFEIRKNGKPQNPLLYLEK